MPSEALPPRPSLDQLRRQAKELRDAARSGDPATLGRVTAHTPAADSGAVTLAAAQLAIAREHGYPSWPRLVTEVRARTAQRGQQVEEFLVASIRDWTGRAAGILARDPWLAGYDFRTAVILGDAARVREMLARDPGLSTRLDERTGWTALHAVCASRWHRLDPARASGLTEVARLLLEAGADVSIRVSAPGRPAGQEGGHWSPLLCAVAGAPNPDITGLLLEHGARPDDHVLYLAAFETGHECLRLLLPYAQDIAATTALSAPISTGDVAGVRLLLDAGADPNHRLEAGLLGESHEQEPPVPPLSAAVDLESGPEIVGLLLERGADPDVPGPDGRTAYQQAVRTGQDQVADLLARHGASTALSSADQFLAACRRADRAAATAILSASPDLARRLTPEDHRVVIDAAGHGDTEAVRLMLDLGFPPGARSEQDDGATALHLAGGAGSTSTVRLLLERGADIEARDTTWDSTPLEWAIVGSGMRLGHDPDPDWPATVRVLLDAGASAAGIVLSPDDPKPPSPEVAALLRARGIPDQ
jgi:ankyrin repeat protein